MGAALAAYHLMLNQPRKGAGVDSMQGAILSALGVPNLYRYDFCFRYNATFLAVDIALLCGLLWRGYLSPARGQPCAALGSHRRAEEQSLQLSHRWWGRSRLRVRQKNGVSFIYREEALGKGKSGRPTIVPVILRDPSSSHE